MDISSHFPMPLAKHEGGIIRVRGTRVSLDSIVYAYNDGIPPEEIVSRFPSVNLADAYLVVGYYLCNKETVDEYLTGREADAEELQREVEAVQSPAARREQLMTRLQDRRSPS